MTGPLDPAQDPDRYDPEREVEPPRGLDMSQDPDRYDAARDDGREPEVPELPRGLDPQLDPDRFSGQSLVDLLGPGAQVDDRDGYQWVAGLIGVLVFLGLVAALFQYVLTPG